MITYRSLFPPKQLKIKFPHRFLFQFKQDYFNPIEKITQTDNRINSPQKKNKAVTQLNAAKRNKRSHENKDKRQQKLDFKNDYNSNTISTHTVENFTIIFPIQT